MVRVLGCQAYGQSLILFRTEKGPLHSLFALWVGGFELYTP